MGTALAFGAGAELVLPLLVNISLLWELQSKINHKPRMNPKYLSHC